MVLKLINLKSFKEMVHQNIVTASILILHLFFIKNHIYNAKYSCIYFTYWKVWHIVNTNRVSNVARGFVKVL